jgi:NAD(P)-dependent dehydrogenase (short-subunit alcohol dehydrogenase family)
MKVFLLIIVALTFLVFLRLLLLSLRQQPKAALTYRSTVDEWADDGGGAAATMERPQRFNTSGRLSGKVALITGAGSGIGRACAIAFAREGARVVLVGRRKLPLDAVAREIGENAFAIAGDISKKEDIERVVAETVAHFGHLHVLVNNAAKLVGGTAETHSESEWDETFDANVRGLWLLSRAALPHMRKAGKGSIINISSVVGLVGAKNRLAYSASKGAVTLMTKAMALDHAHEQIRVNAICPGIVDTELVAQFINNAPDPEAARKQRIALHPLGRFGQPEDIAHAAVYLASDESAWVTGTAIPVDGGYSAV